jgi:hypothetical protein
VPPHCVPRVKAHKEAKQAYQDKLHNTVRSAAGNWLERARGAGAGAAGGGGFARAAASVAGAARPGPVAEGFESHAALRGAALRTVQEIHASRGGSDASYPSAAADAIEAPSPAGPSAMARPAATGLLPVYQPARPERGERFDHLPCWRRWPARLTNRWRLFRQHVDEDPAYADSVAHMWVWRPELWGDGWPPRGCMH